MRLRRPAGRSSRSRPSLPPGRQAVALALREANGLAALFEEVGPADDHLTRLEAALDELPVPIWTEATVDDDSGEDLADGLRALFAGHASAADLSRLDLPGDSVPPPPEPRAARPATRRVSGMNRFLLAQAEAGDLVDDGLGPPPIDRDTCRNQPGATLVRQLLLDVVGSCGADEATLWLLSDDRERLEAALNQIHDGGSHASLEELTVPVDGSAVGRVVSERRAVRIGVEDYQDPVAGWTSGVDVRSMIAAPVRVGGRLTGVLSAVNPSGGGVFGEEDLQVLRWQAYLLGVLLEECRRIAPAERWDAQSDAE